MNENNSILKNIFISYGLLFIVAFAYFCFFGSYIFSYQDRQILFVYSSSYFDQYASKPGGILEYAGAFFSQVFFSPIAGAFLLSLLIVVLAIVFRKICISVIGQKPLVNILMLVPSALIILFNSDFNFLLYNSLGILFASIALLPLSVSQKKSYHFVYILTFPVVYYLLGGYAWIFAGMYISLTINRRSLLYPALLVVMAGSALIFFKNVLFFQPWLHLAWYPLPLPALYKHPQILFTLFALLILFPLILRGIATAKRISFDNSFTLYAVAALLSLVIFILSRLYNPETANLFRIEKLFYGREWDRLISYQEKTKSKSLIAQYYFNVALSEKGQLCSRLFYGPQDYGTKALLIPWDSNVDINLIYRGAYFFWSAGLVNEAHRWAFESMVMQGFRPDNIRLLIKTDLINGHFAAAKKYTAILKKTIRYRQEALHYEKMLNRPDLVRSDPELGKKMELMPKKDFMVRLKDQQANVILMLQSNPSNKAAFEYMMAWYMLERNMDKIAEEFSGIKELGYNRLPDHLEEAMIYLAAFTGEKDSIQINPSTISKFREYSEAASRVAGANPLLEKKFGNTFWYYHDFK
jgi:hypothetical protein